VLPFFHFKKRHCFDGILEIHVNIICIWININATSTNGIQSTPAIQKMMRTTTRCREDNPSELRSLPITGHSIASSSSCRNILNLHGRKLSWMAMHLIPQNSNANKNLDM
jgi:hypothetical protein